MKFIRTLLKVTLVIILISILSGVSYYFYNENEQRKKDEVELSYATDKDWVWHDLYERIQIREVDGKSILRKVNMNKGYVIHVYKNKDYSLSAFALFVTSCNANKEIETSAKFSDGTPKKLKCNEKGDGLLYSVKWNNSDTDFTWEENLGGFSLRENFTYWDFSKLDQEVTLAKAE
ncbi:MULTISPECIES: hypothetical protein [unclassified Photobacterium]|uniref:hypothetical protein n=1 Tax=unclassified Photobacterium TaxID=2628852 RepID=UPI000D15AF39|nr:MULTISPECIES: hypothetical protein [unclassified Photobacterium]PSV28949.1 hypothetical protein C9J42_01795 [Photobacterium sp. GB-56]PSV48065.1 hypothetical protein C9J46_01670 [Photobacterium sp. GB-36]PSW75259.1 hypothetical protein C9J41_01000 [Photobacterium sp. GB-50]